MADFWDSKTPGRRAKGLDDIDDMVLEPDDLDHFEDDQEPVPTRRRRGRVDSSAQDEFVSADSFLGDDSELGQSFFDEDEPKPLKKSKKKQVKYKPVSDDPLVDMMNPDAEREVDYSDVPFWQNTSVKVSAVVVSAVIGLGSLGLFWATGVDSESNTPSAVSTTAQDDSPFVYGDGDDTTSATTSEEDSSDEDSPGTSEQVGSEVVSTGREGGHATGTDAIIAFDNAYYRDRDADVAYTFSSPNNTTTVDSLEEAISSGVPEGTEYTATITPKVVGKSYDVELVLKFPGQGEQSYTQEVEVEEIDGEFYIMSIDFSDD